MGIGERLAPGLGRHGYPRNREPIPVSVAVGADSGPICTGHRDSGVKGADSGATETDPGATEAGLDDLAAVWIGPHDSGVKGVDSDATKADSGGIVVESRNSDSIKADPGEIGGVFENSSQIWSGSHDSDAVEGVSGEVGADSGPVWTGLCNSGVKGVGSGATEADSDGIGVGPMNSDALNAGFCDFDAIGASSGEMMARTWNSDAKSGDFRAEFRNSVQKWAGSSVFGMGRANFGVEPCNYNISWPNSSARAVRPQNFNMFGAGNGTIAAAYEEIGESEVKRLMSWLAKKETPVVRIDLSIFFVTIDELAQRVSNELIDVVVAFQDTKKMEKKVIDWLQFEDVTNEDNINLGTPIKELTQPFVLNHLDVIFQFYFLIFTLRTR
ncbi:uncharacterized protein LOC112092872 [Morus notabilis]|uniref:uncharacterized protein LOC112092872 n=1 Tax=Morus notabilis TaxID=981085 RepID=UPI000CECFC2A|nr:uncharacterized protein LOC112092872 [Morus notabilis]